MTETSIDWSRPELAALKKSGALNYSDYSEAEWVSIALAKSLYVPNDTITNPAFIIFKLLFSLMADGQTLTIDDIADSVHEIMNRQKDDLKPHYSNGREYYDWELFRSILADIIREIKVMTKNHNDPWYFDDMPLTKAVFDNTSAKTIELLIKNLNK